MSKIEEVLVKLDRKIKENYIEKQSISNFDDIYSLNLHDLEEIINQNWDNEFILSSLISAYNKEAIQKKQEKNLINYVSNNIDINDSLLKMKATTKLINKSELFKNDYQSLENIVSKILESNTSEGIYLSYNLVIDVLEELNSKDYTKEELRLFRIRLNEIIGFLSKCKESFKLKAADDIIKQFPKEKLGNLCGVIAILMRTKNNLQATTIIDIATNEAIVNKNLEQLLSNKVIDASSKGITDIYEIIDYANEITRDDLILDLDEVSLEKDKQKTLKN